MTAQPFVILYVEDNDYMREAIPMLLSAPERRISCAADGAAAREALRKQNVNLLITDIKLPDCSGLDIAREALAQNPKLPVIVSSGFDLRDIAESLGPTAHGLKKPFDVDELEALIQRMARPAT